MRIGKITENALKRSVLKQIRTEYKDVKSAAVGSDCAFSNEEKCFSAVSPVVANISDGGYYAVMKAVNALIAQGIEPDHFTLSILLPADAEEQQLKVIVKDAVAAGKELSVPYAGGHTEVTTAVARPVITASAVGTYGACGNEGGARNESSLSANRKPKPGQALIVTKWTALEGTAILAKEKRTELSSRYPLPFIDEAIDFKKLLDIRPEMEVVGRFGGASVHDISSGGIFAALWEIAERAGCGLEVNLKSIPIRQETIEVCEFLEVNPYMLTSCGSLLIACDEEEALLTGLEEKGINAKVIGYLREGNDRIITNDDEKRFLELPQADEIHRILS
jgi:hydrogenase maturation factor